MGNSEKVSQSPIWVLAQTLAVFVAGTICFYQSGENASLALLAMYVSLQMIMLYRYGTLIRKDLSNVEEVADGFYSTLAYLSYLMWAAIFFAIGFIVFLSRELRGEWTYWFAGALILGLIFSLCAWGIRHLHRASIRFFCSW